MQNDKISQSDFTPNSDITLAEILNSPDDNPVGYFVDADLNYSASRHNYIRTSPSHYRKILLREAGSANTR